MSKTRPPKQSKLSGPNKTIQALVHSNRNLTDKVLSLEAEAGSFKEQNQTLTDEVAKLTEETQTLTAQIRQVEEEKAALTLQVRKLFDEKVIETKQQARELRKANDVTEQLNRLVDKLKRESEVEKVRSAEELAGVEGRLKMVADIVTQQRTDAEKLLSELEEQKNEKQELLYDVDTLTESNKELKEQLAQAKQEKHDQAAYIRELERRLQETQRRFENQRESSRTVVGYLDAATSTNRRLQQRLNGERLAANKRLETPTELFYAVSRIAAKPVSQSEPAGPTLLTAQTPAPAAEVKAAGVEAAPTQTGDAAKATKDSSVSPETASSGWGQSFANAFGFGSWYSGPANAQPTLPPAAALSEKAAEPPRLA